MAYQGSITLVDLSDGQSGSSGINTATVYLYQRATTTPSGPNGTLRYTFSTHTLSGTYFNGWEQSIDDLSGSNPIWIIAATATASADVGYDDIPMSEWSNPIKMAQDGQNGQDGQDGTPGINGINTATVYIYKRSDSIPSTPADTTYTFADGSFIIPTNWSREVPTSDGNPCYVCSAVAISNEATAILEWSTPVILVEDGEQGVQGASVIAERELYYLKTNSSVVPQINDSSQITSTDRQNGWTSIVPTYVNNGDYYTCIETTLDDDGTTIILWSTPILNQGLTDANSNAASALAQANVAATATALMGGHFIYKTSTSSSNLTPPSANVVQTISVTEGGTTIDVTDDPTKWGYNTHIGANGIKLRYNETDLSAWTNTGLIFYIPGLGNTNNKGLELNSNGLYLYRPLASGETGPQSTAAQLTNTGLNITEGSIVLGPNNEFQVTSGGVLTATSATITGTINATSGSIANGVTIGGIAASTILSDISTAQTTADDAAKTATTYITDIDSNLGITIKPATKTGNDYLQINSTDIRFIRNNVDVMNLTDSAFRIGIESSGHSTVESDGLHVWTGAESTATNEVAFFGDTARIGKNNSSRFLINASSLQAYDSSGTQYFEITNGGMSADLITAGKLSSNNGKVYFDLDNNEIACSKLVSPKQWETTTAWIAPTIVDISYPSSPYGGGYRAYMKIYEPENEEYAIKIEPYYGVYPSSISCDETLNISGGGNLGGKLSMSTRSIGLYTGGNYTIISAYAEDGTESTTYGRHLALGGHYRDEVLVQGKMIRLSGPVDNTGGDTMTVSNFVATGSKSRLVKTDNYQKRLLYCYETPTPLFGDIGEAIIDEDGLCYVDIDDIFSETVAENVEYQVFLQKEGQGDCWIADKQRRYFVIAGTPSLKVAWELKIKQKDYQNIRLEKSDNKLDEYDYGYVNYEMFTLDDFINEQEEELLYGNY